MKAGKIIGPRFLIYTFCVIALIVSVVLRRIAVSKERSAEEVSDITEIAKYGKPVTVVEIEPTAFDMKEKFTVVPSGEQKFEGYVTKKIASVIEKGQTVRALNGNTGKAGRITYIGFEKDMMTGLYKLEVEFDVPIICEKGKLLVETNISEKKDIIEVPNDALDTENGKFYIWKQIDGRAYKKEVQLSARSGYSSIVSQGLNKGDILIITGQSRLKEGDKVRVINQKKDKDKER